MAEKSLNEFQNKYRLTNRDMLDFKNAFYSLKQKEVQIKQAEENHESEELVKSMKVEFYDQLQDMKRLFRVRNNNITEFEMAEVEYQYCLLSVPKTSGEIERDLKNNVNRIKDYLEKNGGIEFNVGIAEEVAAESPDAFLYFVDDEFQTHDIFGFQEELTWAITISPQQKCFSWICDR